MSLRIRDVVRRAAGERDPSTLRDALVSVGWPNQSIRLVSSRDNRSVLLAQVAKSTRLLIEVPSDYTSADSHQISIAPAKGYSSEARYALSWSSDQVSINASRKWRLTPGDSPLITVPANDPTAIAGILRLLSPEVMTSKVEHVPDATKVKSRDSLPLRLGRILAKARTDLANTDAWHGRQTRDLDLLKSFHQMLFIRFAEDRESTGIPLLATALDVSGPEGLEEIVSIYADRLNSELFDKSGPTVSDLPWDISRRLLDALVQPWDDLYLDFSLSRRDLAGRLYESYLANRPQIEPDPTALFSVAKAKDVRKEGATFFTPTFLARRLVQETVIPWLEANQPESPSDIRVLDPACGSGVFLVAAYEALEDYFGSRGAGPLTQEQRENILTHSLFGVDRDPAALMLARIHLLERTNLGINSRRLPDLSSNLLQGDSLLGPPHVNNVKANAIPWAKVLKKGGKFDLIVANPPFGAPKAVYEYSGPAYGAQLRMLYPATRNWGTDQAGRFIELGVALLREGGRAGFVVPEAMTQGKSGRAVRQFVGQWGVSSLVDCGELSLFDGADVYVDLVVLEQGSKARITKLARGSHDSEAVLDPTLEDVVARHTWTSASRLDLGDSVLVQNWSAFRLRWVTELSASVSRETVALESLFKVRQGTQTGNDKAMVVSADRCDLSPIDLEPGLARVDGLGVPRSALGIWTVGKRIQPFALDAAPEQIVFLPSVAPENPGVKNLVAKFGGVPAHSQPGDVDVLTSPKLLVRTGFYQSAVVADLDGTHVPNKGLGGAICLVGLLETNRSDISYLAHEALLNSSLYQWLIRGLASVKSGGYRQIAVEHIEHLPIPVLTSTELQQLAAAGDGVRNSLRAQVQNVDRTLRYWQSRDNLDDLVLEILGANSKLSALIRDDLAEIQA